MNQFVFRMLGPLLVQADGQPLRIKGRRQSTVLAMLLLSADRIVSVDTLVDAVWPQSPPATARNQIAICVATLRKTFKEAGGSDILLTSPPGYVLARGTHRIDVVEFLHGAERGRDAARHGRAEEACALLEEALSKWRGAALDELSGERIEAEAARLEHLRLDLIEERAGLMLELGRHRLLTGELGELVARHPLREQSREHLMLALYRSGQRAEALEVFRQGRSLMNEELGIEPGPALQHLHELILHDSPELTRPVAAAPAAPVAVPTTPAQLPADVMRFTGRQEELARLDRLLKEPYQPHAPALATIVGVGGVGKTALAVHWASQAADRFPDGQLFADLRGYDEENPPVSPAVVLDRFLRALGTPGPQIPAEPDERAALFRSLLSTRKALVVLDNVRSFAQLRPLLPGGGRSVVLATGREALDDVTGDYTALRIRLRVLPPAEATTLLTRIAGADRFGSDPVALEQLSALCDCLPLALRIAGARLATKPGLTVRGLVERLSDQRRRLDELSPSQGGVRAGFRLTYRDLSPEAARMYRRLGLLRTADFAAWVGAAALGTDLWHAEQLLDQLVDAQLLETVEPVPGRAARYRFQDLLQLFARERAEADETQAECDAALDRIFAAWLWLAQEAHRRLDGRQFPVGHPPEPAPRFLRGTADELLAAPLEWFDSERATVTDMVVHAAETGRERYAWALTESAVPHFETRNYLEDWQRCAEAALSSARRTGDRTGEATMLRVLGSLAIYQRRYEQAEGWNLAALRLLAESGDVPGAALAQRNLAMCARFQGDWDRALEYCRAALQGFHEAGDTGNEAHLLGYLAQIELDRGEVERALPLAVEALALSRRTGSVRAETQSIYRLAEVRLRAGDLDLAAESFHEVLQLSRREGDRIGEAHALRGLGETQWTLGLLPAAERTLNEALEITEELADRFLYARVETDLGCVEAIGGHHAAAAERFERAHAALGEVGAQPWRARVTRLLARVRGEGGGPAGSEGERSLTPQALQLLLADRPD
ncbi:tetratricopeptide repeat protein [Streptomyces sp. PKU-EA00015]|uniref:AfsR/SARP family transcriptional regulator n=1 Tax=Streptomyces sp. PKU-EA00015 TaxID=2748326 RepID=UPI0015A44DF6|nr:BTAD domain-containing putative transcriptional regulator [Streptomyces sp. PKU-EA00015]NWF28790.1 tetratricopeptide repeat protein [Streptomyces sp. PKU-EA00015]